MKKQDKTWLQRLAEDDHDLCIPYPWQFTQDEEVIFESLYTSNFIVCKYGHLKHHHVIKGTIYGTYDEKVCVEPSDGTIRLDDQNGEIVARVDYKTGIIRMSARFYGNLIVSYEWDWAENESRQG